jgi:prepilin-type N-terminal cleavage/methylation domain-containing protein
MRSVQGHSLIEFVIVLIVIGIVAAAASPVVATAMKAYNNVQDDTVALDKVRYVTERLAREIREVQYSSSTYTFTTMSSTQPVFTKADGTVVTIGGNSGSTPRTITLGYSSPAVTSKLVDNVTSLSFAYYDSSNATTASAAFLKYVQITLTLTVNGLTYTERTRVQLRNGI